MKNSSYSDNSDLIRVIRIGRKKVIGVLCTALIGAIFFVFLKFDERAAVKPEKNVVLLDDGVESRFFARKEKTVEEFLKAERITLSPHDVVVPLPSASLAPGTKIHIVRSRPFMIKVDGEEKEVASQARTVREALLDKGVHLEDDDILRPEGDTLLTENLSVTVIRVEIREEVVKKSLAFTTKTEEDDKLSWRTKKVKTSGANGVREITYRVSYHDGKEVGRKQLKSEVTKEPVTEVVVRGTYVQVGKKHEGLGTWYAHTGTLAAASPWLPMGSYAKVTNEANGKSVIVKINDRGPFGPNRIIDLDKVAFEKIASIGAGIINVKVEEIIN